MKVLYLYSEVMGYTMATIRALVEKGCEVHVVHWDHKKLTPYEVPSLTNVHMYKRSEFSVDNIRKLSEDLSPDIVVVSGWMDKGYLVIARELRKKGTNVVVCFDDIWFGTVRQKFAAVLAYFGFFSLFYSHAWVTGSLQFEYARRLGFDWRTIFYDFYSADLKLFHDGYEATLNQKKIKYPRRFLFVGRLEPIKGIDILLLAWQMLGPAKMDWELHLVGNGSLKSVIEAVDGVVVKDFIQPDKLVDELADAGCFILPSLEEPWGVVVHEFAAAGLPLIVSDSVGAATSFVISGLNGFKFNSNDALSLKSKMQQIINMTDGDLCLMSNSSNLLSQRITPETSASNLLSIVV